MMTSACAVAAMRMNTSAAPGLSRPSAEGAKADVCGAVGVRHPAVEIAIEAQQQVDVVERQPHDRADGAAIDGKLGVADAVRVRAHSHRQKRDRRSGPEDASHVALLTSYFLLPTSYF